MPQQATARRPPAQGGRGAQQQPQAQIAFRTGVQTHDEIDYDETRTMLTTTVDFPVLNIPPAGFLQDLYMLVEAVTASNAATVAFVADGPFTAIDLVTLEDVNSAPLVGPFNGFDVAVLNKFGGYAFYEDPKGGPVYSVTTGSGGTGGSFTFILRIPVQLVNRDALGPLPNKSGTSMYKLRIRMAPSTSVYSTSPTTLGTVRIRVQQEAWWDPDVTDMKGRPIAQNPPAVGTTQYWSKSDYVKQAGSFRQPLERVGYAIRNLIFVLRDSSLTRSQGHADWPDPFNIQIDANVLRTRLKNVWLHIMAQNYGYSGTSADTAGSFWNGVFPEEFCRDFGLKPGAETRRGYLETSSATRLEIFGTILGTGSHTITVITNDVAPISDYQQLVA